MLVTIVIQMGLSPSKKKDIKSPSGFSQPNLAKTVSLPSIELVREVQLWARGYLCSNIHRTSEFEFVKNFTKFFYTHIYHTRLLLSLQFSNRRFMYRNP